MRDDISDLPKKERIKWRKKRKKIFTIDYHNLEMVCLTYFSHDKNLSTMFANDDDAHGSTAVNMFNLPCEPKEAKKLYPHLRQACYDDKTELLTTEGWKNITLITKQDKIAQWDNNIIDFVNPLETMKYKYSGEMIHFKNRQFDMNVTPNHRCLYKSKSHKGSESKYKECLAKDFPDWVYIVQGGIYKSSKTVHPDMVRLIVAAQADASYDLSHKYRFRLEKQRKIDRLREILKRLNILPYSDNKTSEGVEIKLSVEDSDKLCEFFTDSKRKLFSYDLLNLTPELRRVFIEELQYWDGYKNTSNGIDYKTIEEHNADFVQAMCSLTNIRCLKKEITFENKNWRTAYRLFINLKNCISGGHKIERVSEQNKSGYVYCVSVPSTFVLTRREGKIAVSGNSKTINFLLMYGGGASLLYENLKSDHSSPLDLGNEEYLKTYNCKDGVEVAQKFIDKYFESYSGVAKFIQGQKKFAHKNKYVYTILGRKRRLPDINSSDRKKSSYCERLATNAAIQGTASDIAGNAQNRVNADPWFNEHLCYLLIQVHDELLFECPEEYCEEAIPRVQHYMEHPFGDSPDRQVQYLRADCAGFFENYQMAK